MKKNASGSSLVNRSLKCTSCGNIFKGLVVGSSIKGNKAPYKMCPRCKKTGYVVFNTDTN